MSVPIDQVTEAQRACLRLVLRHHSSKEIAQIVGVSPSAVDKRIERAVQMLGATSRFAAARMLEASERDDPRHLRADDERPGSGAAPDATMSDPLPSETIDVADTTLAPSDPGQSRSWWLVRRVLGVAPTVRDAEGNRNELRKTERLILIGVLILVVSVATVALLNMGKTLTSMIGRARGTLPRS